MLEICAAAWLVGGCINVAIAKKLDAISKKYRVSETLWLLALSWLLIVILGIDYIGHKLIHGK